MNIFTITDKQKYCAVTFWDIFNNCATSPCLPCASSSILSSHTML